MAGSLLVLAGGKLAADTCKHIRRDRPRAKGGQTPV